MSNKAGSSDGSNGRIPPDADAVVRGPIAVERSDEQVLIDTRTGYAAERERQIEPGSGLPVGYRVANYRIDEELGRGGCSTVYSAERLGDSHRVAIKVMHPALASSQQQVRRFFQEARTVQVLRHPDIVAIESGGYLTDDRPYLVMELIEGQSLAEMIATRGRLAPDEALEILGPVCRALSEIHAVGVIHRDIKASNIMILEADGRRSVKILDFGIAKLIGGREQKSVQTSVGVVLGSLHSLAPEQLMGDPVDPRTDVYGLGVLLYHILTGQYPFHSGSEVALAQMHMRAPPPKPSALAPVSSVIDDIVRRAMAKKPETRYDSALAFLAALERAVSGTDDCERSRDGWAIYVEGRVEDSAADIDDDIVDDLLGLVDSAAYTLEEAEFQVLLQTNQAVLAARAVVGDWVAERARVVELARSVRDEIAARPGADDRIHVNICLHRDEVTVRGTSADGEITGGAVTDIDQWAPEHNLIGIRATRRVLDPPDEGDRDAGDPASRHVQVDDLGRGDRVE